MAWHLGIAEGCLNDNLVVAHPLLVHRVPSQRRLRINQLLVHLLGFAGRLGRLFDRLMADLAHVQDLAFCPQQLSLFLLR